MSARTINELPCARRATVQVCDGARGNEHHGQGLLLDLPDEGTVVLTCHHVIAPIDPANVCIRREVAPGRLGDPIPAAPDDAASRPKQDAAVLRVDIEDPPPNPYLHELNWRNFDGSLDATALIWFGPVDNFGAKIQTATRNLKVPVNHDPGQYVLPVAFRLAEAGNAEPGISGGVVLCQQGVLGLVHFAQRETAAQERQAYLNPIRAWSEGLPSLADAIEPFVESGLREKANIVPSAKLIPTTNGLELGGSFHEDVYVERDVDRVIEQMLDEKCVVLVVGRHLSGKTRLACELLHRHEDALVVLPRSFHPPSDLGERSSFRGREVVLLFENLHKWPGVKPLEWRDSFDGVGERTLMIGTARNSEDLSFVRRRQSTLMDVIAGDPVFISGEEGKDLTAAEGRQLAERLHLTDEEFERRFDGTPGSLLVEPERRPWSGPVLPAGARPGIVVHDAATRARTGVPNNLPTFSTPFVGRERELAEVGKLMDESRVVTLCGPDGRGKTRLAMQIAENRLETYRDGVWWVDLNTHTEDTLVAPAVAAVLGHHESAASSAIDRLTHELADSKTLIVLNGIDDVMAPCADLIERLLPVCTRLSFVSAVRTPLGIDAEVSFEVPRLALPSEGEDGESDAMRLFLSRARARHPDLDVAGQRDRIEQIVRGLNGNPLALELAAGSLDETPLEELEDVVTRLPMPSPDLDPEGAATARVDLTLEKTLAGLGDEEEVLFERLGVFAGSFSLAAVTAIAGGSGGPAEADVPRLARALVDHSLLLIEGRTEESRFRMLDSVRRRAQAKLDAQADGARIRRRHADWYAGMVERIERRLIGKHARQWLEQLEREDDNCRAALTWAVEQRDVRAGLRLGAALTWPWYYRGLLREGRCWLEDLLAIAPPDEEADSDVGARLAMVLNGAGNFAFNQTDFDAAEAWHERCLAIRTRLGDELGTAGCLNNLGLVARRRGDYERAEKLLLDAVTISRRWEDPHWEARHLNNLGNIHREWAVDVEAARDLQEESVMIFTRIDSDWGLGMAFCDLGFVLLDLGELDDAASYLDHSLVLREKIRHTQGAGESKNGLARLELLRGSPSSARELHREALQTFNEIGDRLRVAETLEGLAAVAAADGGADDALAAQLFGAAGGIRTSAGAPRPPALQRQYAAAHVALRKRLGEERYQRETGVGQLMTLHEAIEAVG